MPCNAALTQQLLSKAYELEAVQAACDAGCSSLWECSLALDTDARVAALDSTNQELSNAINVSFLLFSAYLVFIMWVG